MSVTAVVVAAGLDAIVGEPPTRIHPVAWLGSLVGRIDREWTHPVVVGAAAALAIPAGAALVVALLVAAAGAVGPMTEAVAAGVALFLTTSLRALRRAARQVVSDTESDIGAAREGLLALAGRDATSLSPGQLRSAAVESTAENLADGLVGPLGAFALAVVVAPLLGGPVLPTAAAGAAWVKAVNTMDSMLGYRTKPVGTAAARLDDAVMWLPARASALLLAAVFLDPWSVVRAADWLDRVPSPNSGWPMGVVAAALQVRLEKPGVYVLNASAELPSAAAARHGIRGVTLAGLLGYALAGVVAWS